MTYEHGTESKRLPAWLRRPIAQPGSAIAVTELIAELDLNTVCQSAKCPNRGECFSNGTATFMIMGDSCTRSCTFCAVERRTPQPLDHDEPQRIAEAAERMGLEHVVVTTVTRDDLPDGGARHFVDVIRTLRTRVPDVAIEVLTSDFSGNLESVRLVVEAGPDVYNHNIETVPRLYSQIRPEADYARSLAVLLHAGECAASSSSIDDRVMPTKSGLMLGLGESVEEVLAVMEDLRAAGVSMLTLGQYLRPSSDHVPVAEFVEPEVFTELSRAGYRMGFEAVAAAPFVRSSYHAHEMVTGSADQSPTGCNSPE